MCCFVILHFNICIAGRQLLDSVASNPVLTVIHQFFCFYLFYRWSYICSPAFPSTFMSVNRGALYDLDGTGESKQYDPAGTDPRDSPPSAGPRQYPSTVTPVYVPGSSADDEGDSLIMQCYCVCVLLASSYIAHWVHVYSTRSSKTRSHLIYIFSFICRNEQDAALPVRRDSRCIRSFWQFLTAYRPLPIVIRYGRPLVFFSHH
jgi:hypothetical protein